MVMILGRLGNNTGNACETPQTLSDIAESTVSSQSFFLHMGINYISFAAHEVDATSTNGS